MPAPQVTATPQGRLARGRGEPGPQHGERVVGHGRGQRPAPASQRRRELLLLFGQVGAGQAARDVPGDQPLGSHCPACAAASVDDLAEYSHGAIDAVVFLVRAGPADRGEQRAVRGDERDVGLAVPAVDGQHRGARTAHASQGSVSCLRPRTGIARSRRCSRSVIASASDVLPDQRVREQRRGHPVPAAAQRGVEREFLVGRHVRDEAAQQRRQRRGRRGNRAAAADPRRRLDHRVVVEERQRPVVAHVDHLDVLGRRRAATTAARPRPPSRTRRPAAPAAPACGRAPGRRTSAAAPARSPATSAARVGRLPLLGDDGVVRVEVAQVVRGHGAKLRQHGQAAARCAPLSPPRDRQAGPAACPCRRPATARSQVRWFRPTWSSDTAPGGTPSSDGEPALEADRHVAQPDRAVPGVEQRPGHDARPGW